jgi:hypothetical protein
MGEEIGSTAFAAADYAAFRARLAAETALLEQWCADGALSDAGYTWGFEVEAWLLDHNFFPNPVNEALLAGIDDADVVPELSRFNVELNTAVREFTPATLSGAEAALAGLWQRCNRVAHGLDTHLVLIGTLPTIRDADLCLGNISPLKRFHALNNALLRHSGGHIDVAIDGEESLRSRHADVMLEAAATSFQVHLKTPARVAHAYYNASLALSAPILAVSVNAPILFDHLLQAETRIPLFEQSIAGLHAARDHSARVSFGSAYLDHSIAACFRENLETYPVLLPILFDESPQRLRHLALHNGTVWRWNRPLAGREADGSPHVRLEHRPLPAGPSIVDMIANAALYLGLVHEQVASGRPLPCDFQGARANFYVAARDGLAATLRMEGHLQPARALLLGPLLDRAHAGLVDLGVSPAEAERYLSIIRARAASGQTGARWQREAWLALGRDAWRLMAAYCEHQRSGAPVHEWPLPDGRRA